jgi:hypothetical protein
MSEGTSDMSGGTSDISDPQISPQALRTLAAYADLPLAARREEAVAAVLGAWLPEVNALSRKMSSPEHQALAPATTFIHPGVEDGEG